MRRASRDQSHRPLELVCKDVHGRFRSLWEERENTEDMETEMNEDNERDEVASRRRESKKEKTE